MEFLALARSSQTGARFKMHKDIAAAAAAGGGRASPVVQTHYAPEAKLKMNGAECILAGI